MTIPRTRGAGERLGSSGLVGVAILLLCSALLLYCNREEGILDLERLYEPVVVFSGLVNGDSISLPGNFHYPNTCTLSENSLDMCFYSKDFSSSGTFWKGEQMKLSLFVCASDTMISNGPVLFRYSSFSNGNFTYQIARSDSVKPITYPIDFHLNECGGAGGTIEIREFRARPKMLTTGESYGVPVFFSNCIVRGTIQ